MNSYQTPRLRVLKFAAISLTLANVAVIIMWLGLRSPSEPAAAPTTATTATVALEPNEYPLNSVDDEPENQEEFVSKITSERRALKTGTASARLFRFAEVGRTFPLELSVCAPNVTACGTEESIGPMVAGETDDALAAPAGAPMPGANQPLGPVAVGGRVRATLASVNTDLKVAGRSDPVQLIIEESDVGRWIWSITASKPGKYRMLITVTPLRADTDEPLTSPKPFDVTITANDTVSTWSVRVAERVGGALTSTGGALAGLLTAIVALLVYLRSRKHSEPVTTGDTPAAASPAQPSMSPPAQPGARAAAATTPVSRGSHSPRAPHRAAGKRRKSPPAAESHH